MKRLLIHNVAFLVLIAVITKTFANDQQKTVAYSFKSESITYYSKKQEMIYQGNVYVTENETVLTGKKLIVQYGKNGEIKKLILSGHPAQYSTIPRNKTARLYAQAKKIIYNLETKKVVLIQKAKITFKENIFTGPLIWYDVEMGIVRTMPQKDNERTTIIIQPQPE